MAKGKKIPRGCREQKISTKKATTQGLNIRLEYK
jgi:hypothetical protein